MSDHGQLIKRLEFLCSEWDSDFESAPMIDAVRGLISSFDESVDAARWVCVVNEHRLSDPERPYLYGIFTTEKGAREDYGEINPSYSVTFEMYRVFG